MPYFTVANATEETQCPQCGWPAYVGDRAYVAPDGTYCSSACAKEGGE